MICDGMNPLPLPSIFDRSSSLSLSYARFSMPRATVLKLADVLSVRGHFHSFSLSNVPGIIAELLSVATHEAKAQAQARSSAPIRKSFVSLFHTTVRTRSPPSCFSTDLQHSKVHPSQFHILPNNPSKILQYQKIKRRVVISLSRSFIAGSH